MIRNVLYKLGSLRTALAVGLGVPFLIASSAFAQVGSTAPTPAAAGPTPATATGAGNPSDSAIADSAADTNAGAGAATTERVVVTGSYIPTAETESALPVTVYTATVLQKQGANTPAEGLRQLPSFVGNTETENDSNGGDGSAFINLRALGFGNTLVLINGRRTVPFTDINAIPIGALSRSEVLKDGASAIYGSDAVAGVVNFILIGGPGEAPYEGAEVDFLYGNTTDTDARVLQTWIRGGVATDKVSVAAAAEYYDREAIFSRDREISATADRRFLGGANTGSPTYPGRITYRTDPANPLSAQASVLINPADNGNDGAADYRPYGGPNSPDPFNFRTTTPAIPAMEKYQTYVTGRYKVFGEALQIYGDMLYSKRKQDNGLAPAPFGFGNAASNSSPYNPFFTGPPGGAPTPATGDNQLTAISYRSIREGGLRKSFFDYDYYRYVAGVNGNFTFTDNNFISFLGYDTGMVYERGDYLRIDSGDARRTPLQAEVAAGNFNPFIGISAPTSGTATTYTNGVATGTDTYDNVAAFQRASYIGRTFFYSRDFLADAKIFGNLFPNLYQGGVGFNIGYEYRHSRSKNIPDPTQAQGDQLGFSAGSNFSYHQEVNAYFSELQIPIITSTMNIPFVRSLEFQIAYRYEEFDNKDQFTKVESRFDNNGDVRMTLRYQPVDWITMRASFGESFLSPSPGALFAPVAENFPQLFDPLTQQTLQPAEGVVQGGNVALSPETTETYTAGIVLTPKFISGLTVTADLYQLFTRNVILPSADFATIVLTQNGQFLADNPGAPFSAAPFGTSETGADACDLSLSPTLVIRELGTNLPVCIEGAVTQNAGKRLVNGMDVTAAYQLPWTTFGTFTFSIGYNYFFTWKAEPAPGVGSIDFLGNYNNGSLPLAPGGLPRHKGFLRGEYEWKGFNFVATTNYISSYLDDPAFLSAEYFAERGDTREVSDYITLDMQLSYEFVKPEAEPAAAGFSKDAKGGKAMQTDVAGVEQGSFFQRMLWGTKLRVGVVNAFDRQPPTVLGAFNDNYDTSLYSIRNRYYYVGINKKF